MAKQYKQGPYFEIRYGNCNFTNGTTKVNAWILEGDKRSFPSHRLGAARPTHSESADTTEFGDYGFWKTDYLEAKPGAILFLTSERTVRKIPRAGAGILLRIRDGAATLQINVEATIDPAARYSTLPIFVGRADILEYDQAHEEHGVTMHKAQVNNWLDDVEEYEEVFTIERLAPARTGEPTIMKVQTETGVEAVTVDPAPRRKVKVRRG